ncbi:nuclease-related domain-containing protein [Clostridium sp. DL1XJH146]
MAIVKSKEKSVHKKRNKLIGNIVITYLFSAFIPLTGFLYINYVYYIQLILVTVVIGYIQRNIFKIKILNYGIKGEKIIAKRLKKLPKEYSIYNDITLWDGNMGAQIDHLVVAPYGIINIETKNMKGEIIGKEEDEKWTQKKLGKKGNAYYNSFSNPCVQALNHEKVIRNFLKKEGFNNYIDINSLVVFSEGDGFKLNVISKNIAVIKDSEIKEFIQNKLQNKNNISKEAIKKLLVALDYRIEGRK